MIAAPQPRDDDSDEEIVDLETLTLEELAIEAQAVKVEIADISTQLMDSSKRPTTPEDDSPEWTDYRAWRRRARWALVHRKREQADIKTLLTRRHEERREANLSKAATKPPPPPESILHTNEEYAALARSAQERRAALLAALNSEAGADTLTLRLYRALSHLIGDGNGLPDDLDEDDVGALREASIWLRAKFTTSGVRQFVDGRLEDYRP